MVNTRQLLTDAVTFRWDIPSDVDGLVLFDIAFNVIRNGFTLIIDLDENSLLYSGSKYKW